MLTDASVRVVRRLLEAKNRQDVDACLACYSPDATNHGRPAGHPVLRCIFHSLFTAFPDQHFDLEQLVANGEHVMSEEIMSGAHLGTPELPDLGGLLVGVAPTGRRFGIQSIHYFRVVDDRIVEHRAVRDDLGVLQQLGLIASITHGGDDISRPVPRT